MLDLLRLRCSVHVHVVLGSFLLSLALFFVHEGIELLDVKLPLGKVNFLVEL